MRELPGYGAGLLARCPTGPGLIAMVGEVIGIGVLGAERQTTFPEFDSIHGNQPELGLARVGLVGVHPCRPLAFAVRADFGELLRLDGGDFRDHPVAATDRVLDDFAVWWTPRVWAGLVAGRQAVPFSRFRQLERGLLTGSAVPFSIDRLVPDRRWGVTALGDLGALGYAVGGYIDEDSLELRAADDPSASGRALVAAHVEWTPRAPMGRDHRATPTSDPWYPYLRASAGAGLLYRPRDPGVGDRVDLSLSGQAKYRGLAALAELLLSADAWAVSLGGAGEASILFFDKAVLFGRGDYDAEAALWSLGAGASYFVTEDRQNKVSLFGWVRRDTEPGGIRRDGVIAQLQASL